MSDTPSGCFGVMENTTLRNPNRRVRKVLYGHSTKSTIGFLRCTGVELDDGSHVFANLVILAAGAWTPSVVDLEGRATATCQVLSYLPLNEE